MSPEWADKVTQNHNCDNSEHVGSAEEPFEACSPFGCSAVMCLSAVESDPAGGWSDSVLVHLSVLLYSTSRHLAVIFISLRKQYVQVLVL